MTKNIVEDVRAPRSIRDIPIPIEKKKSLSPETHIHITHQTQQTNDIVSDFRQRPNQQPYHENDSEMNYEEEPRNSANYSKYLLWGIVVLCILVLFFAVSSFFTGATVSVTRKSQDMNLSAVSLSAQKNGQTADLEYQTITLSEADSAMVPAQGTEEVDRKASGTIVIYNNFSTAPINLIKNTRFQTPAGLIYRINNAISIPGKKGTTPGRLEVVVYADQTGASYNIDLSDFTIPGFQTDKVKFAQVYGRSKTAMTGGAQGLIKKILPSDELTARTNLENQITQKLIAQAKSQTPDQFVLYANGATTTFEVQPNQDQANNTVQLNEKGTLNAIIINKADLAKALAQKEFTDYDGSPVEIASIENLNFSLSDPATLEKTSGTFLFTGSAKFIWDYDSALFKEALKGKSNKDIPSILTNFPAISKADVVIRPFWISTLPSNTDRIKVVNVQ